MKLIRPFLDVIFPPLCLYCRERCSTRFLCPDCWQLCEPPDPVERCRHCFGERDERGNLCTACRFSPRLSALQAHVFDAESPAHWLSLDPPHGWAGFAVYQWTQLEWPLPDAIIPMPDSLPVAKAFAEILQVPFIRALNDSLLYREDRLEEERLLLLFATSPSLFALQKATQSLAESFPKRIYLLSLFSYADSSF